MVMIYKEKKIYCGKYLEIDITPSFKKRLKILKKQKDLCH